MKRWPIKPLGDFVAKKSGSVDPSKFPDEVFDLYSIPAFDSRQPEIRAGSEIGSAKQIVQSNDVLLSRIVPHIRRAWVVGQDRGRRLIASGEWIVFRSPQLHPDYLRFFLGGDPFNARFMQTVTGVGGSLLRAKASEVYRIELPVPPLAEQERIVKLLDETDELRKLRTQADTRTANLVPALFNEMFGDPVKNPMAWPVVLLAEATSPKQWPTITQQQLTESGYPVYGANGKIGFYSEFNHVEETVLITCRGATCGTINVCEPKSYVTGNAMSLDDPNPALLTVPYLASVLRVRGVQDTITGSAQPQITRQSLARVSFPAPPLPLQKEFAQRVDEIREMETAQAASRRRTEDLFQSMLHKAFNGEL